MAGQRIGYVRVSSLDQNEQRQLDGQALDRTFTDKASGRDTNRPELAELLRFAREGDTVVVHSMDRLARNLDDLRFVVKALTGKGVQVEFVKEHLLFTGEDSPMANLMLSVMGAFAEFERSLIRERQREGIALAKQRGAYRGRRKALTQDQANELARRAASGTPKSILAKDYGISRETVYQYLRHAVPSDPAAPPSVRPIGNTTYGPLSASKWDE
ncbi:recombinase family protein [Paenarthrobacter sp. NPDC091669]|uniref:recombinase family protein n=2 Tax=Micrococcales TaxID=85006 RepID=UPI00380A73CE